VSAVSPAMRTSPIGARSLSVALVMSRVEAKRMLRHPLIVLGALSGSGALIFMTWNEAPVLNRHDSAVAEALIPVAATLLIVAHFASMRAVRSRATDLYDASPTSNTIATTGLLLAVGWVAAASLLLQLALLGYMETAGAVGAPRPPALLVGPAGVLFAGALGVALGRWTPWLGASPLALIALVAISALVLSDAYAHPMRGWLAPFVMSDAWGGGVSEFALRPHGPHLLYVVGLATMAAFAALARYRRAIFGALACVAVIGTTAAGYVQVQEPTAAEFEAVRQRLLHPDWMRACEEIASVRYCVFSGYEPWTNHWRRVVTPILAAVPPADRPALTIAQLPTENEIYEAGWQGGSVRAYTRYRRTRPSTEVNPSLRWARNSRLGDAEIALGVRIASHAVGIEDGFVITEADVAGFKRPRRFGLRIGKVARTCTTLDQGRSVVALWMAASATPEAQDAFERAQAGVSSDAASSFDPVQWGIDGYGWNYFGEQTIYWGTREALYAEQLLARDDAEVRSSLARNWGSLIDPDTTTDEAAALLGLQPLPSLNEIMARPNFRTERYVGSVPCH
jgi:hypothetical protein